MPLRVTSTRIHRLFSREALRPTRFARGSPAAGQSPRLWAPFAQIIGAAVDGKQPSASLPSPLGLDPQLLGGPRPELGRPSGRLYCFAGCLLLPLSRRPLLAPAAAAA